MRRITIVRALPALCIGVTLTGIWLGCADEAPSLTVTQGCSLSSECQSPLVCAFAKCHQACKSSRDCTKGERCVQSDRPYYVCQKQSCSRNSDCLGKQVCAQDGECHDECLTQKDCLADQVCTTGACADTSELVNGTLPNKLADGGDGTGQRCTLPTDCPGDLVCLRGGVCGAECIGDKDCRKTYTCKPVRAGGPGRCFPQEPLASDAGPDATSDASFDASAPPADSGADASDGSAPLLPGSVLSLAMGHDHTCAMMVGGKVKCWGGSGYGQLGLGDTQSRGAAPNEMGDSLPYVELGTGRFAKSISAGAYHTCALLDNDKVKCWGGNIAGALGLGDTQSRGDGPGEMGDSLPYVELGTGRSAKAVAAGGIYTCVVLDNDKVKCWGSNDSGLLGLGDAQNRGDGPGEMGDNLPYVELGTGRSAKAVAPGHFPTCTLLDNDKVKCWGRNDSGELGLGDAQSRGDGPGEMGDNLPFVELGTGRSAKALAAGSHHICARLDNDKLKCWGHNLYGTLGLGDDQRRGDTPGQMGDNLPYVELGTGRSAKTLAATYLFTCSLLDNDKVKCWGTNNFGQLGLGDTQNRGDAPGQMGDNLPYVELGTGRSAKTLAVAKGHTCAVLDNDKVKCWGANNFGQLGLGDTQFRGMAQGQMGDNLPYVKLVGP